MARLVVMFVVFLASCAVLGQTSEPLQRFSYSQLLMGVRVTVTLYAPNQDTAESAAKAAFSRYAELEQVMSDYRPSSELMQLCAKAGTGPVPVSHDLFVVLQAAESVSKKTDGAFDITASPVIRLWREARKTAKMPDPAALKKALALVGWQNVVLDPLHQTVDLRKSGMQLDLGGIAKGYANDEALLAMKALGIDRAMIEGGGDISVSGPPPGHLGWAIKVHGVPNIVYVRDAAVSTSGDTEQFVDIGGKRYSHVVDPHTGLGVTNRAQATVIASRGIDTDPYATSLTVRPELEPVIERLLDATVLATVVQ